MIDYICKEIIKRLDIHFFIETGTDMGETVAEVAKWFSDMDTNFGKIAGYITTGARGYDLGSKPIKYPVFEDVGDSKFKIVSVDIDTHSFESAKKLFNTDANIQLFCENSPNFLKKLINKNVFRSSDGIFFLDAHWGKYWPLRDEIKQILRLEKFIIVIDDFFVPNRSNRRRPHGDFGFDFYYGRVLDWGYIRDLFSKVDVRVYYPVQQNRDRRGFVFLFKGYDSKELEFLEDLPFEYFDKDDAIHKDPTRLSPRAYLDFRYLIRSIIRLALLRMGIRTFQKFTYR